jgi:hypothetical protein
LKMNASFPSSEMLNLSSYSFLFLIFKKVAWDKS